MAYTPPKKRHPWRETFISKKRKKTPPQPPPTTRRVFVTLELETPLSLETLRDPNYWAAASRRVLQAQANVAQK